MIIYLNGYRLESHGSINLKRLMSGKSDPDIWSEMIIYAIVNNKNGKIYIGKALELYTRFSKKSGNFSHLKEYAEYLEDGGSRVLFKAFKKYGLHNFTVYIIDEANDNESLKNKEIYWIKTLNTCILDQRWHWGYNMTWGGEDCSYLHQKEILDKAICNSIKSRLNRYGSTTSMMLTKEARFKANINRINTNLVKGNGDNMYMCHTDKAMINSRNSIQFNSITSYLEKLKSDGAPLPITFEIYWNWSDGYWSNNHFYRHLRNILDNLNYLRSDYRWTSELEVIFSELESNKDKYLSF